MLLKLYEKVLVWSSRPRAPWYLGAMSFAESSFFPIPPDVLLAPMCLARPKSAFRFASITVVASVLGGLFGYALGFYAFALLAPYIQNWGYAGAYQTVVSWFSHYGVWAVFIAGFSPVPYKIFTIAAGAAHMPLLPFLLASMVGRGLRFYGVAFLTSYGHKTLDRVMKQYIDRVGWWLLLAVILVWYSLK